MTGRNHMVTAVGALALASGLAACGGGVSKTQFVTKAEAACAPGNTTLGTVATPTNLPELATAAATVATTADAQAAALRKVDAPGDDKALVAGVIGAIAEVAAPARALQEAAGKTDDAVTAKAVTDLKAKTDAAAVQATGYGLTRCGPGLKDTVTALFDGTRTVLKAAFVARADSLCSAANRKADALSAPTSLASASRFLTSYLAIEEKLFGDIKVLVKPPGDEGTIADMLAAQDLVIAKDKEQQAAAQKGNQPLYNRIESEFGALVTQANSKFDAYGLRNCGTLSMF